MRHPVLWDQYLRFGDEIVRECNCHRTDKPYTYEGSLDKARDLVNAEANLLWKAFEARHRGRICRYHCHYNRTIKKWHSYYSPLGCARDHCCQYCPVLAKELDPQRGNVFYDVKETRTIKGDWLFPDKETTIIRKGIKVLDRTASLTLCDAIIRYAKHDVIRTFLANHETEMFHDKSLRYELINFRAQRQNTRDIMQDLADTDAGIKVVHQADADKLRKEQKRARKKARLAQIARSLEKLLLTGDLEQLTHTQKRRIEKYLSEERITELMEQRSMQAEQVQTSLFT